MTWAPPANLATDMEPETTKKKDVRRGAQASSSSPVASNGRLRLHHRAPSSNSFRKQSQKQRRHMPSRWPHAEATDNSDFDDEHHKENMQDLRRSCPPQTTIECLSSSPPRLAPPQLRLQNNQWKGTSNTPGRTDYQSPRRDPSSSRCHHRCQNRNQRLTSANHVAKMPPSTGFPVVVVSKTMPPRRRKTRRRLHRPI